jgi:hypothetical protein
MAFFFTLDDEFENLEWQQPGGGKPTLTNEQAMVVAVAGATKAMQNIALQLHQALDPLQEIADALKKQREK